MKLSGASLVSILAAGLVSAQEPLFSVTGFSAGATPHSSVGHVDFSVSFDGASETKCSAKPQTAQSFPNVSSKTTCADPKTSFSLTRQPNSSADLEIKWREVSPGVFRHGRRVILAKQIVWGNQQPNPNGAIESYVGPDSFTFSADK